MIWSLQTLRFVAALMVTYVHAAQIAFAATGTNGLVPHSVQMVGRAGVDIFFVISGVVIALTAPSLTAQQFAWRRVRRILPIYFVACVPAILIGARSGFGWRELVATLFLWPATDRMVEPLIPVAWTLCFEMLFYAAATLVLVNRMWLLALLLLYGAAMVFRQHGPVLQFLGNPLIIEFLFGVLIARAPMWRPAIVGLPIGFILLVIAGPLGIAPEGGTMDFLRGDEGFQRVLVYGIPSALIVYGAMQIKTQPSVWTYLGDTSYSLYLFHTFIVSILLVVWTALPPINHELIVIVTMTASVIFSWRMHELFEKPILNWLPRQAPVGFSAKA